MERKIKMTTGKRKRPPSRINGKHNPEYYKWKYNNDPSWRRKRLYRKYKEMPH